MGNYLIGVNMFSIEGLIKTYEIKKSKTNHDIPIINGVHLHSIYNPIKEAEDMVANHEESLKSNPCALVLGLGMGHHLPIIEGRLLKYHKKRIHISVIDPNRDVFDDYLKTIESKNNSRNVHYFIDDDIDTLYESKELIKFLTRIPTLIVHSPSFNLYSDFYKSFLSYHAPKSIHEYVDKITDSKFRKHISSTISDNPKTDLKLYIEGLKKSSRSLEKYDHILIATKEMIPT